MEEKQIEQLQPKEEKVASIGNQYTKEQIQEFNNEQRRLIFRRRRLAVIFTVATVIFIFSGLNLWKSSRHIASLRQEKATAEAEQVAVGQRVAALEYDVKLLENDEYLQKLARQKYFYTKEGELVFNIPSTNQNSRAEAKTDEQETKKDKEK